MPSVIILRDDGTTVGEYEITSQECRDEEYGEPMDIDCAMEKIRSDINVVLSRGIIR